MAYSQNNFLTEKLLYYHKITSYKKHFLKHCIWHEQMSNQLLKVILNEKVILCA